MQIRPFTAPRPIDYKTLSDEEAVVFHDFFNARRREILPDDPPIPLEERLKWWREPSPHEVMREFAILDGGTIIGTAGAEWRDDDAENPDIGWVGLNIAPEFKRKGLGTVLLRAVLEAVEPLGRRKLFCSTNAAHPEGEPFVQMLGAKKGQEEHTNQLLFSELDREYVQRSLEKAPKDRFEIVFYETNIPQSDLQMVCDVYGVMNTAPRGDLEFNDWKITPEKLLEDIQRSKERNHEWWLMCAKDLATGTYAGFTETGWHPNRPHLALQYGTGVWPEYRGHGLGAWLKTAMIDRILRLRPSVDRIRTGNADSNGPMLKINHALGFKPYLKRTEWQLDVQKTLELLRTRG
jgi:mycothiol synthase